ncbi:MAG: RluA family pseudouridine synthase [Dysgonomonas sp.]|nr:RluA family pseudouridine synthase [Dysgonomonas sp.]
MRNTSKKDIVLQELKATESVELLEFLINKQVRKSRSAIKSLLAHKQIKVNGKLITQFNHQLKSGDKVYIMKFDQSRKEKKLKGAIIVFEDDDLIIVDKEAGYLSVSTDKEKVRTIYNVLNEYVKKKVRDNRVFVLHRLDREASGLLIFAKNAEIQEMFQKNWEQLVRQYTYSVVIYGRPEQRTGTVVSWLSENKNLVMQASSRDNGGLKAVLKYKIVKTVNSFSLAEIDLETRRKNQLRVQMQSIGHPVVGDKKYGAKTNPIKRIALHAGILALKHPVTGEVLEFKSTMPKAMQLLVTAQNKSPKETDTSAE